MTDDAQHDEWTQALTGDSAAERAVDEVHKEVIQPDGEMNARQKAYEAALGGSGDTGFKDLPPNQTTHVDGVPVEKAAEHALGELNQIRQLQNLPPLSLDQAQAQQAPAEPEQQAPAEQPRDRQTGRFVSAAEAVDFLAHGPPEPMTPEEAAQAEAEQLGRALESGQAVDAATETDAAYEAQKEELLKLPGIDSEAFGNYAGPIVDRMLQAYDLDERTDPRALDVMRQVWERSGGAEFWGSQAAAVQEEQAYRQAIGGRGPTDEFGTPLPEDDPEAKRQRAFLAGEGP